MCQKVPHCPNQTSRSDSSRLKEPLHQWPLSRGRHLPAASWPHCSPACRHRAAGSRVAVILSRSRVRNQSPPHQLQIQVHGRGRQPADTQQRVTEPPLSAGHREHRQQLRTVVCQFSGPRGTSITHGASNVTKTTAILGNILGNDDD